MVKMECVLHADRLSAFISLQLCGWSVFALLSLTVHLHPIFNNSSPVVSEDEEGPRKGSEGHILV